MHRYCSRAAVLVSEPLVRTVLADFHKAQSGKDSDDLAWFENRPRRHSGYRDNLRFDELVRHCGRTLLQDHGDGLPKFSFSSSSDSP